MVCTLGRGKMAAMVRLLASGNNPELTAEEASHEKLAAQTIHREFREADVANLLEEEDMHVFDLRPLVDPLHLVCCNACKKPVKASQYAAHAERCISLNSAEDIAMELDGGGVHKKPPRKARIKLRTAHANQKTTIGEREKSESVEGDDVAPTGSNIDDQNGGVSSISREGKNVPAPLATKIYHSQRSHHFRAALGHLYSEAVAKEHDCDFISKKLVQDSPMLSSENASADKLLLGVPGDNVPPVMNGTYPPSAVRNPDQILAQSSELCLGSTGGYPPPAMSFSNQFQESNIPRSGMTVDTASVGMMRTRNHLFPYPFPSNTGTALGTMQQPNGSVPVV